MPSSSGVSTPHDSIDLTMPAYVVPTAVGLCPDADNPGFIGLPYLGSPDQPQHGRKTRAKTQISGAAALANW